VHERNKRREIEMVRQTGKQNDREKGVTETEDLKMRLHRDLFNISNKSLFN